MQEWRCILIDRDTSCAARSQHPNANDGRTGVYLARGAWYAGSSRLRTRTALCAAERRERRHRLRSLLATHAAHSASSSPGEYASAPSQLAWRTRRGSVPVLGECGAEVDLQA